MRGLIVSGHSRAEILEHCRRRWDVSTSAADSYIAGAHADLRRHDEILPDAAIERQIYRERLLESYRQLGAIRSSRANVQAIRARVEVAERLAELEGVRSGGAAAGDGDNAGFVLVFDPEPAPRDDPS